MKNLEKIFNPKTIAIIGASPKKNSVGWGLVKNILEGKDSRKFFYVNPFEKEIGGIKCFSKIGDISQEIDLAVIAVRAKIVPQIVEQCCRKKVGGIIIISSGFAEIGKEGEILQDKIIKLVKSAKIPLIGPNCLGIIRPSIKLNVSFAPAFPKPGNIAFISQSGALIDSIIDKSLSENYGFSFLISYGNEADLTLSDFLLFVNKDRQTKVITVYLEGLKGGRNFMKVAKKISKIKPIVVLKAGRTEMGKKAVFTHTASLAGNYQIYQALFKQTGIIGVETIEELFDIAKVLAWQPKCKNGIGIITNGGGCGVLMADYCQELGVNLVKLDSKTIQKLKDSKIMHPAFSRNNPLDIVGDALSKDYQIAIEALLKQKNIYGLLIIQTLQIMTEVEKNAKIIVEAKRKWPEKPIVCCFLGGEMTKKGVEILEKNKIPNYPDLKRAAKAMKVLIYE
ncbi:hypothetical protein COS93_00515 [bacterium (Candidatus Gribaldobacteria) CG07_land_8_20_14_0_80_33_18]|uniref:CoA-binding domain-containing protein n=1 Tax=bacterium (Candidatus Gribaldobacteria) CG07_land_8_20_14_0_80_33_18 TaxID=2014272 RepID=A0A2M6Z459_9BACT|nr:MAG: hypothetical protein COS93_00515 [bacterium (Candidatus Gribaldobacteria) CG07_land_8_20_14_0_80_33_18]PJA00398.1 MAG: hypothetical protein COX75_02445 [bacterium (Candidatus Gribaldobacteria) CG_4_10_14_0_2_um_filter_33_15]PJB09036.1 MAG: hypothetical protein CO122_00210 [bacterium (Candidatus Gribaldobacteria) CG_4_9_14_3_um_filter_33_9]